MTQQIITYEDDYRSGGLAKLCAMQSTYYAHEWGFDHRYEAVVSAGMSAFLLRYDPAKDLIVLAICDNDVVGGIVIDCGPEGERSACLHWFFVSDKIRGHGVGFALIKKAMDFVRKTKIEKVFLSTFSGLNTARSLYEKFGFRLVEESEKSTWGKSVMEQRFEFDAAMYDEYSGTG